MSARFVSALILWACLPAAAQEQDAATILRKVEQTYKDLKSQYIEATIVIDMKTQGMRMEMPTTMAILKPDKVRFEIKNPMMGTQTVSDGQNTWMYMAMLKQYTKKKAARGPSSPSGGPAEILTGEKVMDRLKTAKLLRQEKLSVNGTETECYVLEAEYMPNKGDEPGEEGPKTFWVDKERSVILKAATIMKSKSSPMGGPMEVAQTATVTSFKLNDLLRDSLFVFVPPDDAKEVDELTPPGTKRVSLKGKDASDFTLAGLGNDKHSLSQYRGKVVLLDFWTTWCAPCRADMPLLQKLHAESTDKDTVVIAVNVGESVETVREFMVNHQYTFSVLIAVFDDQVVSDYNAKCFRRWW